MSFKQACPAILDGFTKRDRDLEKVFNGFLKIEVLSMEVTWGDEQRQLDSQISSM